MSKASEAAREYQGAHYSDADLEAGEPINQIDIQASFISGARWLLERAKAMRRYEFEVPTTGIGFCDVVSDAIRIADLEALFEEKP